MLKFANTAKLSATTTPITIHTPATATATTNTPATATPTTSTTTNTATAKLGSVLLTINYFLNANDKTA